jgi:hypothetical protein
MDDQMIMVQKLGHWSGDGSPVGFNGQFFEIQPLPSKNLLYGCLSQ